MAKSRSRNKPVPAHINEKRHVNERGQEWQAEKLTGNRAQKGLLSNGLPNYVYEVSSKPYLCLPALCISYNMLDDS